MLDGPIGAAAPLSQNEEGCRSAWTTVSTHRHHLLDLGWQRRFRPAMQDEGSISHPTADVNRVFWGGLRRIIAEEGRK
jgi:hypothetical protein